MSVILKGMKMPDHCWECWLMRNLKCGACGEIIPSTGKRNHCPLVALPDHHGRLVDADVLIEKYWDGNSMTITAWDLKDIKTVIEAEDGI